jgi:hypothetical protein
MATTDSPTTIETHEPSRSPGRRAPRRANRVRSSGMRTVLRLHA